MMPKIKTASMTESKLAFVIVACVLLATGVMLPDSTAKDQPRRAVYTVARYEYGPDQLTIAGPNGETWISVTQGGVVTIFYGRATPEAIHDFCQMIAGDAHIAQPVRCWAERKTAATN